MKVWICSLLIAAVACLTAGCDSPKQVSGAEFIAMLESGPHTMHHFELMGVRDGKVILKKSSLSVVSNKWKESYFCTPLTELPEKWKQTNLPGQQTEL